MLNHLALRRVLLATMACFAMAAVAQPALAASRVDFGAAAPSPKPSGTKPTVSCKRVQATLVRCTMTIKGGTGISGTVSMRITRATLLVARGHGRVTRGKATLTMRLLHPMPPGRYTVTMVVTLHATRVLRLR